jgi:HlyD family secretion protein
MEHKRPSPLSVILVILIVLALVGWYYLYNAVQPRANRGLTASGTVETTEISIAPELSGKVVEIHFDEGADVLAGFALLYLDDTMLKAQRAVAAANMNIARAQYDIALNTALNDEKANRTANWTQTRLTDFNQPSWYFNKSEQTASVQDELAAAKTALDAAHENLKFVAQRSGSSTFLEIEKRLLNARTTFQVAQEVLTRANSAVDGQDLKDEAQNSLDDAESELSDAQEDYDDALTTDGAKDVLKARAGLAVAQERYNAGQDKLRTLRTGEQTLTVAAAQAALERATADLNLIDVQIGKLRINAPANGRILTRSVELGEVVNPGSVVFTLGQLSNLTITVYVPEDLYGRLYYGQLADVKVDSFPGVIFLGRVVHISDKGEFTPRNVQTAEGRKATVYAIKLRVEDPYGNLKPGMPADVTFIQ